MQPTCHGQLQVQHSGSPERYWLHVSSRNFFSKFYSLVLHGSPGSVHGLLASGCLLLLKHLSYIRSVYLGQSKSCRASPSFATAVYTSLLLAKSRIHCNSSLVLPVCYVFVLVLNNCHLYFHSPLQDVVADGVQWCERPLSRCSHNYTLVMLAGHMDWINMLCIWACRSWPPCAAMHTFNNTMRWVLPVSCRIAWRFSCRPWHVQGHGRI